MNHLDYIQNRDGPWTSYGNPYRGYCETDISKLNCEFGTADDLKLLSKVLHDRKVPLMVNYGVPPAVYVSSLNY